MSRMNMNTLAVVGVAAFGGATATAEAHTPSAHVEQYNLEQVNGHDVLQAVKGENGFHFTPVAPVAEAASANPADNVNVALNIASANQSASLELNGSITSTVVGNVIIGEDVHPKKFHIGKGCHFYANFINTEKGANGQLIPFEDHNATLCPNPNKRERQEGYPDIKIKGGETGRDCGNPARPIVKPQFVRKVLTLPKLNIEVNLQGSAMAQANTECGTAEAQIQVNEKINLLSFLRLSAAKKAKLLANLKHAVSGQVQASGSCVPQTPPVIPPTPVIPKPPTPPTIEFTALPPAQEQFTDGTTNQDCAIAVSPNGDAEVVEFSASDTNGSIGPVYQPDSVGSPNLYCAEVTIAAGDNSADPSFAVDGKVTDIVTGLTATAVDNMGTQPMPSFGS